MFIKRIAALFVCSLMAASGLAAATIIYHGSYSSAGNPLEATASFELEGNMLRITLTNDAGANTWAYTNSNILMAVFFGANAFALEPDSAVAEKLVTTNGTIACGGNCDVGEDWQYKSFSTPVYGAYNGISAAGFGLFDTARPNFGGDGELDKHGIVPAGYPGYLGTRLNSQWQPFALHSVVFTLEAPAGFTLSQQTIGPVTFQYETSLNESVFGGTIQASHAPEPVSFLLLGCGLAAIGLARKRIRPRR